MSFGQAIACLLFVSGVGVVFLVGTFVGFLAGWKEAHLSAKPAPFVGPRAPCDE